ncbi:MAG: methyltransferase domain-containing protein, partial [Saprospiraceae bacterium]|nr:methyltransferase domain-containing protein [Saprospiraceae bacterium]
MQFLYTACGKIWFSLRIMKREWFAEWFDSPYYHTLYKNRDENEARRVLDNLLRALELPPGARVLDLACGKGRHARYLAEQGFDVTGLDISASSIGFARQFEHERLHFYQHDMRLPFRINYFDAVVNFFTSFGYFQHERDHIRTLKNVCHNLKPGGLFLLDFFNAEWVKQTLVRHEHKVVDAIPFDIRKSVRNGHVYKTIEFITGGRHFAYRERVRLFTLSDFEAMFQPLGLGIRSVYGSYDLAPYD